MSEMLAKDMPEFMGDRPFFPLGRHIAFVKYDMDIVGRKINRLAVNDMEEFEDIPLVRLIQVLLFLQIFLKCSELQVVFRCNQVAQEPFAGDGEFRRGFIHEAIARQV
ncbi:hypothetical protein [Selenomonas sp.]|uniref:hypothetical protein n=1 Tax=Selenomonas sp. TaxID=2053611 RepID=UPI002A7565DB|nr:hypothetical protein [Selenomonas sp.]MDY3298636.1 hypothetical protein [Selenomonas sp.]